MHELILLDKKGQYLTKLNVNSKCGRYLMVKAVSDWVLGLGRNQEVCRNHARACGDRDPSVTQLHNKQERHATCPLSSLFITEAHVGVSVQSRAAVAP